MLIIINNESSGDTDGRVPVLSTRYSLSSLALPITRAWRPWYHQKQVIIYYYIYIYIFITSNGVLAFPRKPTFCVGMNDIEAHI